MQSSALLHYYLQQFSGRSCADSNGRPVKCHPVRTAQLRQYQDMTPNLSNGTTVTHNLILAELLSFLSYLHRARQGKKGHYDCRSLIHLLLNLMLVRTVRSGAQQIDVFILPPFQMPSRRRLNCSQAKSGSQKRNWPF